MMMCDLITMEILYDKIVALFIIVEGIVLVDCPSNRFMRGRSKIHYNLLACEPALLLILGGYEQQHRRANRSKQQPTAGAATKRHNKPNSSFKHNTQSFITNCECEW